MKGKFYALLASAGLFLAACNTDTYHHQVSVLYPTSTRLFFADETGPDSVVFITFDNFQVFTTNENGYNSSWIKLVEGSKDHPTSAKVQNAYNVGLISSCFIEFDVNNTGAIRNGIVAVRSYADDFDQRAYAFYSQVPWLEINRPSAVYTYDKDRYPIGASFTLNDSTQRVDSIAFIVRGEWTLTDGKSFAHPTVMQGRAGQQKVKVELDANPENIERLDSIFLTSKGITTKIRFKQLPRKEEK